MISYELAVVGAGAAGLSVSLAYRDAGGTGRVLLVGDEQHPPYDRPELSKKVLTRTLEPEACYLTDVTALAAIQVDFIAGASAVNYDPRRGELTIEEHGAVREVAVEGLVLATGGSPRTLPIAGMELHGVFALRTIDDAAVLREALPSSSRVVVIGAGFLGTELAAAARTLGCDVTLIDVVDRPLPSLPSEVSHAVRSLHEERGVRFRLAQRVVALHGQRNVAGVELADGEVVPADLVVVAVGMQPNDSLAARARAEVSEGVLVDAIGRTSVVGLYAVGDVARRRNGFLGERHLHEHWKSAHHDGARLGRHLATGEESAPEIPWCWTDQYNTNIQVTGTPRSDDEVVLRGDPASGSFLTFHRRGEIWSGIVAVDRPREARMAARLVGTVSKVTPSLLADESHDLRQIVQVEAAAEVSASPGSAADSSV